MDVKEALLKRRSIRKFKDEVIPKELIEELIQAGMSAPSACNKQTWEFFVIQKEEILTELRKSTRYTNIKAKLAIVVCGNLSRALPLEYASYWIQDCSAATQNILLRATSLELGAVWCGIHPQKRAEKRVSELLNLEDKLIPLNIIWIGFPIEEAMEINRYDEGKVHFID